MGKPRIPPETRAEVFRLAAEGRRGTEIARTLGLSRSSVNSLLQGTEHGPRAREAALVARLRELAAQGLTKTEVCDRLDLPGSTLYYLRRRHGIELARPQRMLSEEEVARLVAMAKAGATQVEIASALGITQSAVSYRFASLGIEGRPGRRRRITGS